MDQSIIDLSFHNYLSLSISEFQNGICSALNLDPEDPRCSRLTISGSLVKVPSTNEDYDQIMSKMIERHPQVVNWKDLNFYLVELEIKRIWLIDYFGGGYNMPLKDYYAGTDGIDEILFYFNKN